MPSSANLVFLMSAILLVGGLLLLRVGMADRGQVNQPGEFCASTMSNV